MTEKQLQLLRFIGKDISEKVVCPSFDEMCKAMDLKSKSGIHRIMTRLEELGFVRWPHNKARAIELTKKGWTICNQDNVKELPAAYETCPCCGYHLATGKR